MARIAWRCCPLIVMLVVGRPSVAFAADDDAKWGITLWGLSYHVDKTIDYSEGNWGLGVRYYVKPRRLFLEGDALRNSNRGLVLPISAGAELGTGSRFGCRLSAVGALTLAYYRNQLKDTTELKFGPVPGLSIGCGHLTTNMLAVLRASHQPLAAIVWSLTYLF
jgi:hypothetical protein